MRDLFVVAKWGNSCSNRFFRIVYESDPLWLTRQQAQEACKCGWDMTEAFGACATLSHLQSLALYYIRPKIHMMQHVVIHGCTGRLQT